MVNAGSEHNSLEFTVESIRQYWSIIGRHRYPNAKKLMICADGDGFNKS